MHIRTLVTAGAVLALAPSALAQTVVITNVMVLDGTGTPARRADVRIVDGTIESIGGGHSIATDRVIDARGLTLAPGFIDTHSHHDGGIFDRRNALAAVSQGVTTVVVGQDGESRCRSPRSSHGSIRSRRRSTSPPMPDTARSDAA